ncbi:MAG: polyribonucleotide nucleotidyltransferase [Candidatus Endobugula sp.]|jgi:polyribonucleotide nucleotidyltransferase
MLNVITKTIEMPDGQIITIETGKLAKQADGSVVVRMGNTMLLATVVASKDAKEDVDFLPLSVDYQEKFASSGKIPGGFLKREGRLSDHEILISRLVDRALRPLFPADFHADTQVMISMISHDANVMPDSLAALAASAAIAVSNIPFNGPISEARVVKHNGEFKLNPSKAIALESDLDIIVAASIDNITMVEGEMNEASEADMLEAMKIAHAAIKIQCQAQIELTIEVGKTEKREYNHEKSDEVLFEQMKADLYDPLYAAVAKKTADKSIRSSDVRAIKEAWMDALPEDHGHNGFLMSQYFKKIHKSAARNFVLTDQKRLDGRDFNEIRQIWGEVDYLPSAHGSAVFTRGETQSLTSCTLGTKLDEQMIDGATENGHNKFILHYNFPGFSTGETRPNRGPGRREVGHGNLAMRALKKVLPAPENNPYTIRLVSDILESNGSSSMATVCAGTMALLDTGIKIIAPVSGIAMGMISDAESGKYAILSDILGDEDHLGDMDFKVTGTEKGITACQMDIKVDGLSYEVLEKALNQAKEGRLHILEEMKKVIAEPRADYKPHVPRSEKIIIGKDQIGAVIGPGGKVVQEIQKSTGATVIIEEEANNGVVTIFAENKEAMQAALARIKGIVAIPEVGEVYEGKVKSIMPFGAFVEFMPGKDGLLHISEIKWERVEKMDGIMEVGEEIAVKLVEIDKKTGKYRLSRKALLPNPSKDSVTKED